MKFMHLFLPVLLGFSISSCGVSAGASRGSDENIGHTSVDNPDQTVSLADHLRKLSGVYVSGSGPNATVTIRGANSVNASSEPLFVVNGQVLNGGLRAASQMVPVNDIKTIRILKNPSETGIYGVRGANGVIEIELKKGGD